MKQGPDAFPAGAARLRERRAFCSLLLTSLALDARAALADTIARAKPAIVAVGATTPLGNPRFAFRGTGFAVAQGRLIVTNAHVLPDSSPSERSELAVYVPATPGNRDLRSAAVVAVDIDHDLALVQIDGAALQPLQIAGPQEGREGDAVAFIGFPLGAALGFRPVTHQGIISAVTPIALPLPSARLLSPSAIQRLRSDPFDVYQLDATAYPGNSGGPLLDTESGKVLGVVNSVFIKGAKESALTQPSGITYAIPAIHVARLLKDR